MRRGLDEGTAGCQRCLLDHAATYRLKSHCELASIAPKSEYTIMPFQYGKGDLVTCAKISWDTWYEKLS